MAEIKGLFTGEDLTTMYKKFRPNMKAQTAQKIIEFLAEKFTPSECNAADVGCGSGQGTLPLAPFLHHIVGLDPSEDQIKQIRADSNLPSNVEFQVGEAENLPFQDSSLQLINVKSALHWFDLPKFLQEVDRVLQPGGVLAVSCGSGFTDVHKHEKDVFDLVNSIAAEVRTPDLEERINRNHRHFEDVKFPYEECVRLVLVDDSQVVTLAFLMSVIRTRSDVAKFLKENPEKAEKALQAAKERLIEILGATGKDEDIIVTKETKQHLVLCRKP